MTKPHDVIEAKLASKRKSGRIRNYLINSSVIRSHYLWAYGQKLGGAYGPVVSCRDFGGNLLCELNSGKVFRTDIEGSWLTQFEQCFVDAAQMAYDDPCAKNFLGPQDTSKFTRQFDSKLDTNPGGFLVEQTREFQKWMLKFDVASQYSALSLHQNEVTVTNSVGLAVHNKSGLFEGDVGLGSDSGFSFRTRKMSDVRFNARRMKLAEDIYLASINKAKKLPSQKMRVLFTPDVFAALLEHFLLSNLEGLRVYKKFSRFKLNDFESKMKICHPNISLTYENRKEMTPGASNFSGVGWVFPPRDTYLAEGRLVKPFAGCRTARLLDIPPNASSDSLELSSFGQAEEIQPFERAVADLERGLLVTQILGLHTQDEARGDFSLVAPRTIIVKNGKMTASIEIMIRGNFFDMLSRLARIYRDDLTRMPYASDGKVEAFVL